jgi:hypothetical protein
MNSETLLSLVKKNFPGRQFLALILVERLRLNLGRSWVVVSDRVIRQLA